MSNGTGGAKLGGREGDLEILRAGLRPKYTVDRRLGKGGMAEVYLGRHEVLDRAVAVKVLPRILSVDDALVRRFLIEARSAARLHHPHIIPIFDVGQAGPLNYIIMAYMPGGSLKQRLDQKGKLGVKEACRIIFQIADALAYAHQEGVIHRDIKPDNVMFDKLWNAVLMDFGIAKAKSESRLTSTGTTVGTPRYMSPEQLKGLEVDGRSDLYSLGVVFYEMLVGKVPFEGEDSYAIGLKHIQEPPVPPIWLNEEVPEEINDLVLKLLEKNAERRCQAAGLLQDALLELSLGGEIIKVAESLAAVKDAYLRSPSAAADTPGEEEEAHRPAGGAEEFDYAEERPQEASRGAAAFLDGLPFPLPAIVKQNLFLFASLGGVTILVLVLGIFLVFAGGGRERPDAPPGIAGPEVQAFGSLRVSVNEAQAEVYLDGRKVAESDRPEEIVIDSLAAGAHIVSVRRPGYDSTVDDLEIDVPPDGASSVRAELSITPLEMEFQRGRAAESRKDSEAALASFESAAEGGHAEAQYLLGQYYLYGSKSRRGDTAKALEWLHKAASQGHLSAANMIGWIYLKGLGVQQDNEKALQWIRRAAEGGNRFGQFNLGAIYERGQGIGKDITEAVRWYRKAAEQGHAEAFEALNYLGVMPPPATARRIALVVGNSDYRELPLPAAAPDARRMSSILSERGFLVHFAADAGLGEMEQVVDVFLASLMPGDVVLVFYSGYVIRDSGEAFLVPIDLPPNEKTRARDKAISFDRLFSGIESAGARMKVLLLDGNRDSPYLYFQTGFDRRWSAGRGSICLFVNQPEEREEKAGSLFVTELERRLSAGGASLSQILSDMRRKLPKAARGEPAFQLSDQSFEQLVLDVKKDG